MVESVKVKQNSKEIQSLRVCSSKGPASGSHKMQMQKRRVHKINISLKLQSMSGDSSESGFCDLFAFSGQLQVRFEER